MESEYFISTDPDQITREKNKAKEFRRSQWWKHKRASGQCHYCQGSFPPRDLTMDHVVPLSRGGLTTKSNLVPCCKTCNNQKRELLPLEWEEHLERLRQESSP